MKTVNEITEIGNFDGNEFFFSFNFFIALLCFEVSRCGQLKQEMLP